MAYLDGVGTSWRARGLRPYVVGFFVLLAGGCASRAFLHAAPLTLQLKAIVGPPRQGADAPLPPSWNISLQEGDAISGTFTFEPFDAASNVSKTTQAQPFDFSIQIKDRTLTTSQYGIEVFNDRVLDDAPEPTDVINIGCSFLGGGAECNPATVSAGEPIEWSFGIAMFGESAVLDGADIPADPLTWQELVPDNTMLVSFKHPVTGWSFGFLAAVKSFREVPEPTTCVPIALSIMFIFGSRRVFCRQSD